VGAVLTPPLDETLPAFFRALTPAAYVSLRDAALLLDPNSTRFTEDSCRAFAAELAGAAA
jgi:hypothetical protein